MNNYCITKCNVECEKLYFTFHVMQLYLCNYIYVIIFMQLYIHISLKHENSCCFVYQRNVNIL